MSQVDMLSCVAKGYNNLLVDDTHFFAQWSNSKGSINSQIVKGQETWTKHNRLKKNMFNKTLRRKDTRTIRPLIMCGKNYNKSMLDSDC